MARRGLQATILTLLLAGVLFADTSSREMGRFGPGPKNAWNTEIFDNINFTNKRITREDKQIRLIFGAPDPTVDPESFSIRWQGNWEFQDGGEYIFEMWCDDGIKIWIDGHVVLDRAFHQWSKYRLIRTLDPGYHHIRVDYFEEWGAERCILNWTRNPGKKMGNQIIADDINIDDGAAGIEKAPKKYQKILKDYFENPSQDRKGSYIRYPRK